MNSPISWLVESGGWLYFAGTAPLDDDGKVNRPDDVITQTETIIGRFRAALESQGLSLDHLVFVTVYLADLADYAAMNKAYARLVPDPFPARKMIQTPMRLEGMVVEMTALASRDAKIVLA